MWRDLEIKSVPILLVGVEGVLQGLVGHSQYCTAWFVGLVLCHYLHGPTFYPAPGVLWAPGHDILHPTQSLNPTFSPKWLHF